MSTWQDRFLGLTHLPEDLSTLELEGFFRLAPKELAAIKAAFKANRCVAVALQVCFFRFSGTRLDKYNVVPRGLLQFLGDQFEVPAPTIASLQSLYQNKSTRKTHQGWAADWVGIRTPTDKQDEAVPCRARGQQGNNVDRPADRDRPAMAVRKEVSDTGLQHLA